MKIRGLARACRLIGKVRRRLSPPPLVLLYHRVADVPTDPQLLSVSPKHFCEHLEVLRHKARVFTFGKLASALYENSLPPASVAVTFDDGYLDNLEHAKPALEAADVPALIYIPTGFVGGKKQFWWDKLEMLLLHPGTLPGWLRLTINGKCHMWNLGEFAAYTETHFERFRYWNVLNDQTPTPRHEVYLALCELLRPLSCEGQEEVLEMVAVSRSDTPRKRIPIMTERSDDPCCVSNEKLQGLADGQLLDFGAHTVTHCALGAAEIERQENEIVCSRKMLEEMLNRRVTSFSYPYGHYTPDSMRIVQDAGFSHAVTTEQRFISSDANCFEIPRVVIRDWDGDTFERKLREWQIG